MPRQIYQLRIVLRDVTPPVWRRVLVPGGYTLDRLHRVIQYALGWQDRHLHCFDIGGQQYGEPDPVGELAVHDESTVAGPARPRTPAAPRATPSCWRRWPTRPTRGTSNYAAGSAATSIRTRSTRPAPPPCSAASPDASS